MLYDLIFQEDISLKFASRHFYNAANSKLTKNLWRLKAYMRKITGVYGCTGIKINVFYS